MLFLHPDSNNVHYPTCMCPYFPSCIFRFCCAGRVSQTATTAVTINHHEVQRTRKLLGQGSRATKRSLGTWNWSQEDPHPNSESVIKALLWSEIEWVDVP